MSSERHNNVTPGDVTWRSLNANIRYKIILRVRATKIQSRRNGAKNSVFGKMGVDTLDFSFATPKMHFLAEPRRLTYFRKNRCTRLGCSLSQERPPKKSQVNLSVTSRYSIDKVERIELVWTWRPFPPLLYWVVSKSLWNFVSNSGLYDTRCYFNVRSKADISQLNLPNETLNISPRDRHKLTVYQQNSLTVELVEHTVGASWLLTRRPSIVML